MSHVCGASRFGAGHMLTGVGSLDPIRHAPLGAASARQLRVAGGCCEGTGEFWGGPMRGVGALMVLLLAGRTCVPATSDYVIFGIAGLW